MWSDVSTAQARSSSKLSLMPDRYRLLRLNEIEMKNKLAGISQKRQNSTIKNILYIPLPEGEELKINLKKDSLIPAELANKYPSIRSYKIEPDNNNGIYGAVDFTDEGFHAMLFLTDGRQLFIDPRKSKSDTVYISYYRDKYHPNEKTPSHCAVKNHQQRIKKNNLARTILQRSGSQLKTYRLAMAATAEYTNFHGGTKAGALSAMVTTISRVNVIFERDLAVKMKLIGNTDLLIYTNSTTDPYTNGNTEIMLDQNQANTDITIGSANYDIGHVVGTGNGGLATTPSICNSSFKAQGTTGSDNPIGDPFDIDLVSHEIGHQFGAQHSFNSTTGSCGNNNRSPEAAFEPGSGSTIMGYAGICDVNNLQNNSDAMFHSKSIQAMGFYIDGSGSCGTATSLNNAQPSANAGQDYTIPTNTAFELTGTGTDFNGDTLSYSWEQIDAGDASDINVVTSNNAIFRTFLPTTNPTRTFPKLASLMSGMVSKGEPIPNIARLINFSFVVRDGKGGVATDNMRVTTSASPAFKITSHTVTETLIGGANTTVTWNVGNTAIAPINCATVDISISTDAGHTFSTQLAHTANDGSETVSIPASIADSTTARLKVKCANNIFFDISDVDLTTQMSNSVVALNAILSHLGTNNAPDPGEKIDIMIPLRNNTATAATAVSAILNSSDNGVSFINANSSYPNISPATTQNNSMLYEVAIQENHSCTSIPLTLNTSFNSATTQNLTSHFNIPLGVVESVTKANTTSLNIPDASPSGITSSINIQNIGVLTNPNVTVDINISHPYRGDISLALVSPAGTTVSLKVFDGGDSADNIIGNYPTTLTPIDNLSVFSGENFNGNWVLKVADNSADDFGTLNHWKLNFQKPTCTIAPAIKGDENYDGIVNIVDVFKMINIISAGGTGTDCNGDNQSTITDVFCVINIISGN